MSKEKKDKIVNLGTHPAADIHKWKELEKNQIPSFIYELIEH